MNNPKTPNRIVALALCSAMALSLSPAHAADKNTLQELLQTLRDNGTIDQQTYDRLKNEAVAPAAVPSSSAINTKAKSDPLEFTSADGELSAKIGGRLVIDGAVYDQDKSAMGNGTEIRQARVYVQGKFHHDWTYKNQFDFAGGEVSLKDIYVQYQGFPVKLKLGNYKEPFSLEEQTSRKYIIFMERALPDVFFPGRKIGFSAAYSGKRYSATLGVFDNTFATSGGGDEADTGVAVTGRLTFNPLLQARRLIHLGVAASYRTTGDNETLRFRIRPETHISGLRLVDTGDVTGVDNFSLLGLEAATVLGPFALQGEYMFSHVDRDHARDPLFSGWYAQVAYALTGEARAYSAASGKFTAVHPLNPVSGGGFGEWQLGARVSELNLSDAGVDGGKERNVSLALNWYPETNLRFEANYVKVLEVDGGPHPNDEPSIFQVRAQVYF